MEKKSKLAAIGVVLPIIFGAYPILKDYGLAPSLSPPDAAPARPKESRASEPATNVPKPTAVVATSPENIPQQPPAAGTPVPMPHQIPMPVITSAVPPAALPCRSKDVPKDAGALTDLPQHLCALAACGGTDGSDTNVFMLSAFNELADQVRKDACRLADRSALQQKIVMDALFDAIKRPALPSAPEERKQCRAVQNQLFAEMRDRIDRLRTIGPAPAACGDAKTEITAAVQAFLTDYQIETR
ncbi:MAG: hypothetical protein ACT4N2_14135 [Hyphomicrobium sp.]